MTRIRDRHLSVNDRGEVVIPEDAVLKWLAAYKCRIRCGIGVQLKSLGAPSGNTRGGGISDPWQSVG